MKILTNTELTRQNKVIKGVNSPSDSTESLNVSEIAEKDGKFVYKTKDGEKEIKVESGLKKVVIALSKEDWVVNGDKFTYTITPELLTLPPSVTYGIEMQVFNYKIMMWERVAVTPNIDQEGNIIITSLSRLECNIIVTSGLILPPPKPVPPKIYGVDQVGRENPIGLPRTGEAVGAEYHFIIEHSDSICVSTFDNIYPYSEMKVVKDAQGNYFVKIPKFYHKYTLNNDGTLKVEISKTRVDSTWSTYFVNGNKEIPYIEIGSFFGGNENDKLVSKPAVSSYNNLWVRWFRAKAESYGLGYHVMDMCDLQILQVLFIIEFATTNCQSVFYGNERIPSIGDARRIINNGSGYYSTSTGIVSGDSSAHTSFCYRGIENPWGGLYTILDGAFCKNGILYICNDIEKYNDYTAYEYVGELNTSSNFQAGCLEKLKISNDNKMTMPNVNTSLGTEYSTYFCNRIEIPPKSDTLNLVRINTIGSPFSRQGLWAYDMTISESFSNSETSTRLCYKPISEV